MRPLRPLYVRVIRTPPVCFDTGSRVRSVLEFCLPTACTCNIPELLVQHLSRVPSRAPASCCAIFSTLSVSNQSR